MKALDHNPNDAGLSIPLPDSGALAMRRRHATRLRLRANAIPLVAAAAAAAAAAAFAPLGAAGAGQERPLATPQRDVAVTYRMAAAGPIQEMRIAWLAAEQRMRLDMPGQGYMIVDQRAQRAFMVMDETRMVMEIPFAQNTQRMAQLPPGARLTREGQDRVAGTSCTVWAYQESGHTGRSCITEDGVVLRVVSAAGAEESMEATAVAYGPQEPARFRPPADYAALSMPGLPPMGAGGAAAAMPGGTPPGALPFGALPPGALPPGALPPGALPFGALPAIAPAATTSSSSSSAPGPKPANALPPRAR